MSAQKLSEQLETFFQLATELCLSVEGEALLILVDRPHDWDLLKRVTAKRTKIIVVADEEEQVKGAREADFLVHLLHLPDSPVYDKLTQALLTAVANELVSPGAEVVALYSGFEAGRIDSLSRIRLDDHLGRLTARDLRKLETKVPLDTLKAVVDLAIEIGREGREGKPVGTIFVVGDSRNVLKMSGPLGFDPVKGYSRAERDIQDPRVREAIKEIAPLDGAVVVSSDGIVQAACRYLNASAANVTLSKGLGARHWAAAAITKKTKAVAVTVSESNGTVRIFHRGEVLLRVEPFRRAMKWKDFEYEPPNAGD